jgi:hypothetical protein
MKGHPGFLLALLGLVLTTSLSVAIIFAIRSAEGPVCSVATLQAGLAHQPRVWLGWPVRVRGIAALCLSSDGPSDPPYCHGSTYLMDAGGTTGVLPLAWGRQDRVLAVLRRVPLLSRLLPALQAVRLEEIATYRVELRTMPGEPCGTATCYEAVLLDAAP